MCCSAPRPRRACERRWGRPAEQRRGDRLSGQPAVRDRRVTTETVADLAQRPEGYALLKEDYELSDEEIREAVEYEADVAEALVA